MTLTIAPLEPFTGRCLPCHSKPPVGPRDSRRQGRGPARGSGKQVATPVHWDSKELGAEVPGVSDDGFEEPVRRHAGGDVPVELFKVAKVDLCTARPEEQSWAPSRHGILRAATCAAA